MGEMIGKFGMTHKTHLIMEYEYMRWVKIMLPTTNTWLSKELGIEIHYQPTNEAKLHEGGNIKLSQEIILFNGFTISELKFYGKMLFNYISMHDLLLNGMLPKLSVETIVHKDEKLIYQYLLT